MYTLEVSLTTNCNLKCYYCFAKNEDKKNVLELEEFSKSLEIMKEIIFKDNDLNKNLFIKIYGGEPLLYQKRLKEILEQISKFDQHNKQIKIFTVIITNGTLLSKEFSYFINEINKKTTVKVSFSFEINENFQNKIRSFKDNSQTSDLIIKNIENFKNINNIKRASLQTVMSPDFLENINEYINFIEKNKKNYVFSVLPMFDKTFNEKNIFLIKNMEKLFEYYEKKILNNDYDHINFFQIYRSFLNSYYFKKEVILKHCSAGDKNISVMPGKILACSKLHYKNKKFNIFENSNDFQKTRKMYSKLTEIDIECKICMSKNNNFGCLGICLCEGKNEFICSYNIKFGLLTKNFLIKLKENKEFLKYFISNYSKKEIKLNEIIKYLSGEENV